MSTLAKTLIVGSAFAASVVAQEQGEANEAEQIVSPEKRKDLLAGNGDFKTSYSNLTYCDGKTGPEPGKWCKSDR